MAEKPAHKLQFFKVLLPGFSKKLVIPPAFIRWIIGEKRRRATILSPLGGEPWPVKVEGDFKRLYFGTGWPEFVRAHNLDVGFFLVFRYEGHDLIFSLEVFDPSGVQKLYTPKKIARNEQQNLKINVLKDSTSRRPITRSYKQNMAEEMKPPTRRTAMQRRTGSGEDEELGATSHCKQGSHFKAIIKPYNLSQSYMHIPSKFRKLNNISRKVDHMNLRDPKGKLWTVCLHHTTGNRSILTKGWQEFAAGNNLELGDQCMFELASAGPNNNGEGNIMQFRLLKNSPSSSMKRK